MKIDSGTIGMESVRSYRASKTTVRRFMVKEYQANLTQNGNTLNTAVKDSEEGQQEEKEQVSEQKEKMPNDWQNRFGIATKRVNLTPSRVNVQDDIRQATIRYIFEMLFAARRGRLKDWMEETSQWGQQDTASQDTPNAGGAQGADSQNSEDAQNGKMDMPGVIPTKIKVLSYMQETHQFEREETSFSTTGTVRTADGREINFNVNVGMSREFESYYREDLDMMNIKLCDPLVINLDTDVAKLSDQNFYFDIDADGEMDEISQLGSGSGYLALDKNADGTINDGSELFGTSNGDGFADLARYDEDGNGWIDENDAIWSKLKIWCKDENGKDVLYRLADKGVGAICLQKAATDFTLQGSDGATKGAIRSTGVFLYENGNVGTMQHVDVAKYYKEA